jgi:hypothetical protein
LLNGRATPPFLLQEQEMTRDDAVNYIDRGIRRKAKLGAE